ncbi:presequence protease, mitochondrial [Fopius arisanus]|uniref:Presequence protease, mitochondrial n=1 Tax=Fopius arisanus TaxID=64838 RepID=A0A0C9QIJ8_9HYME|nr:PREDICTED: presequence protease, mitochondrial [Fopius arisanus]
MSHRFSLARRALAPFSRAFGSSPVTLAYKPGDEISNFKVTEVSKVPEMHVEAIRLTHTPSGAQYLHLNRDDLNNVFCIGFRTIPLDSTGVPHILEHMTLCGSDKYPIRDPFMKMLHRSLATFLNAMTGPDYTIYPFSTQNPKDFRNLQSVYASSVFSPRLRHLDFLQEGWRLEHSDLSSNSSPIIIKGVVYNEMKGVFNENQTIFAEKLLNSLLPSHTYGVCSGGLPLEIPNLTHDFLKDFHSKYYHPSSSKIFSYGNFPFEEHLKFMDENYLCARGKIDTSRSMVPTEKRWEALRREHIACKIDPMAPDASKQSSIAIGHVCNDIKDIQTSLELHILSELLLKGPTSAFYKGLIETNLGSGFGPFTGYDSQCRDALFVVSLQGVDPQDFQKIEKAFDKILEGVISEGFDKDHVEAVIHSIELRNKHQSSNFGMNLLFSVFPLWNHEGDIVESLRINKSLKKFKDKLQQDPKYLTNLAEKYLLKNNHRLILTMSPEEDYDQRIAEAEENLIKRKIEEQTPEELDKIFETGQVLREDQEKKEDLNILPTLKTEDLKADVDRYKLSDVAVSGIPLQVSIQPTNGVLYYRGILDTKDLSSELKELLPLFNDVVARMGTQVHDYRTFDRLCSLKSGGLGFSTHISEDKSKLNKFSEGIMMSSYCLMRNTSDMWKLWEELFNKGTLDDIKRFENLVKNSAVDLSCGIADSGHHYAMSSAAALVSSSAELKEKLAGLEFVSRMKKLSQLKDLSPVLEKIQEIRHVVMDKRRLRSAVNYSEDPDCPDVVGSLQRNFYDSLKSSELSKQIQNCSDADLTGQVSGVHHVMPYNTNYTSKAVLTVPYGHPDYPALRILGKLISSVYLLPEVREKEGAYGSGASLSTEGVFMFFSYRDPNSTKTFDTFDRTCDFLKTFDFKDNYLNEAKLGVFQQIDAPVAPGNRGLLRFTHGITEDDVQRQRILLKAVTKDDVVKVAEKYLGEGKETARVGRAIIGGINKELMERRSQNWRVVDQEEEEQKLQAAV